MTAPAPLLLVRPVLRIAGLFFLASAAAPLAHAFSSVPPPDRTGAPGSIGTCADCHVGDGDGTVSVVFGGGALDYEPGESYSIEVQISDPGQKRFGFSMVVRPDSAPTTPTGTWTAGSGSTVHANASHIGHASAPFVNDEKTFTMTWTAPATDVGPVTFYAVANAANGNFGSGTGDNVYFDALTVNAASAQTYRDLWIEQYFGAGANVDFDSDTDKDGLTELEEYAFGFDPKTKTTEVPLTQTVGSTQGGSAELTFRRDPQATDLTYRVESSTDLVNWSSIAESSGGNTTTGSATISEVTLPNSGGIVSVMVTSTNAASSSPTFFRFVLETAP